MPGASSPTQHDCVLHASSHGVGPRLRTKHDRVGMMCVAAKVAPESHRPTVGAGPDSSVSHDGLSAADKAIIPPCNQNPQLYARGAGGIAAVCSRRCRPRLPPLDSRSSCAAPSPCVRGGSLGDRLSMCDLRLAEITPGTWGRAWGDGRGREGARWLGEEDVAGRPSVDLGVGTTNS